MQLQYARTELDSVNSYSFRRKAFAAVIAGALVLAACGDDDDDDAETTEAAGGADTTAGGAAETTEAMTGTTEAMTGTTEAMAETTDGAGGGAGGEAPAELASGEVFVTGSSTVEPISTRVGELAGELSGGGLAVTVEGPGTGDGFATFCAGDADISDASRPINDEEIALCEENGVEFVELEVAIDGLTVATNPANDAITCLDVPGAVRPRRTGVGRDRQLGGQHRAGHRGRRRPTPTTFPAAPLDISGPGEESGTYDTFVEFAIADLAEERGQEEVTRADYASSPNDNLIVDGIESSESSLGWVGYAFYAAEEERMKAIEIDVGDGCVAPTPETIADGTYGFSRPLFIYVNAANAESNAAVASYVDLYLSDDGLATVSEAGYVDLPDDRVQVTRGRVDEPLRRPRRSVRSWPATLPPGVAGHDSSWITRRSTPHDAHGPGSARQPQAAQPRADDAGRVPVRRRRVDRHQPADPLRPRGRGDQLHAPDRLGFRCVHRHWLVPAA